MGWKLIFQAVVEIRTGWALKENGGLGKIGGGNSANYATAVKMQSGVR